MILAVVVVALVALAALVVVGVAYGAKRNQAAFARQNEVVPGTPSRAPAAWAGAHTPEARLHRRLGEAVVAARAQTDSPDLLQAIERGALEIDDRLIAAAALPAGHREAAIAAVVPSVEALEQAVAGVRTPSADTTALPEIEAASSAAQQQIDAILQARAEVEQLDAREQPRPHPGAT